MQELICFSTFLYIFTTLTLLYSLRLQGGRLQPPKPPLNPPLMCAPFVFHRIVMMNKILLMYSQLCTYLNKLCVYVQTMQDRKVLWDFILMQQILYTWFLVMILIWLFVKLVRNDCRQVKCVCVCVCVYVCVYNRQSVFNTAPFRLALHSLLA